MGFLAISHAYAITTSIVEVDNEPRGSYRCYGNGKPFAVYHPKDGSSPLLALYTGSSTTEPPRCNTRNRVLEVENYGYVSYDYATKAFLFVDNSYVSIMQTWDISSASPDGISKMSVGPDDRVSYQLCAAKTR